MAQALPRATELRAVPKTELGTQLEQLRQELWQVRIKAKEGSLQQTHRLRALRRQIARVQTVLGKQA